MKFARCTWTWRNLREWTPRRAAAARQAIAREQERVRSLRDQVALFPEMQAQIQPRFTTEEERKAEIDARENWDTATTRAEYVAMWRKARAAFYQLPPRRRRGMILLWNRSAGPKGPYNFAEFVRRYSRPGISPWTHLRKVRIIWHWNHGGWPRPAHFQDVTSSFDTLGRVTHPRVITQSRISLAMMRGISLRTLLAENRR